MKRAGFVLLWVAASFATALMAWSAVRLAGDQVAERPVRPLSADEVAALAATTLPTPVPDSSSTATSRSAASSTTTTSSSPPGPSTTTTRAGTTSTSRPPRSTTTSRLPAASTTTTSRPPAPSSTTTTTAAPSTTSTAPPSTVTSTTVAATVTAYQLTGGSVVIAVSPGQVTLVSASPRAGFAMEIEAAGPAEVRVEFDGDTESKFRARWSGGSLDVDIDDE